MKRTVLLLTALTLFIGSAGTGHALEILTCWFPPGWKTKTENAKVIAKALSDQSGVIVRPKIAESYPEILSAFSSSDPSLVYVGSFVQAIIRARDLGTPLVQAVNGKEFYSGILIHPKEADPQQILAQQPEKIAFAAAASSGESSAKAATGGKADVKVASHGSALEAVQSGRAAAAVVKNWWWEANKPNYPGMVSSPIPEVSIPRNPDNILTASKNVSPATREKIVEAAMASAQAFGADAMVPFDAGKLDFSLGLMRKGQIDPMAYSW